MAVQFKLDMSKWDAEFFHDAAEGQFDLEAALVDGKVPELVLQNNGHLFRILRAQPVGNAHAVAVGVEGDEEMVVAGQALFGGVG